MLWHFNTVPVLGLWRLDYGNLGVRVFFLISGFLITSLLLKEDTIHLRQFYVRRFARIMPAYWLYLTAIVLLIPTGAVIARYRDFLPSFFYLTDYVPVGLALGATWSLSVEEQFYLLWPSVLRLGKRRAVIACAMVLVLAPAFRVLSDLAVWPTNPRYAFESVCDALASGCLLAMLRDRLWAIPAYRRLIPYALALPVVVLLALAVSPSQLLMSAIGVTALNLSIAVAMDHLMRRPYSVAGRCLNSRPFVWVGALSYSLYLWQQPFGSTRLPFSLKLIGTLMCACASFYLIESPLRKWINASWGRGSAVGAMKVQSSTK
jgi:peptidoglycan/LPS O-acetylase OafA/YrhL